MSDEPVRTKQQEFYRASADHYDAMLNEPERRITLLYVSSFLRQLEAKSVLDVGCGTGRALKYLVSNNPNVKLTGIEPVQELIDQARMKPELDSCEFYIGNGEKLPYKDDAFDVVCAFAVLHHVPSPNKVVAEMMRVAQRAVFISDSNRFGQGRRAACLFKVTLWAMGIWP